MAENSLHIFDAFDICTETSRQNLNYLDKIRFTTFMKTNSISSFDIQSALFNLLSESIQILHGHPCRPNLQLHRIRHHQVLPVSIYRSSKNARKCSIRRLRVEFLENGLSVDHEILRSCRTQSATQTCRIWHDWLLLVDCKIQLNQILHKSA